MKMQLTSMCALALAAVLISPLAAATRAAPMGANTAQTSLSLFAIADADHDGTLKRSEIPPAWADLRAHFEAQDKDHDHRLSQPEFNVYLTALIGQDRNLPDERVNANIPPRDVMPPLPAPTAGK